MCGIVGVRRFDGVAVDRQLITAMTDTLAHRGPDGRGLWIDGHIGFGHTRLSIIDLAGSPQPMSDVSAHLHLCFNGEIFNYRELRHELDYPFQTDGDTETLLAVYARYGAEGVQKLRGQFAYAIYDDRTGDLWLFRDRLGVLPLYYFADHSMFAFASEIKALVPAIRGGARLDARQLPAYLTRRAVPAPDTLFAGVRKSPPGHIVRVRATGAVDVVPYWSLPDPGELLRLAPEEAVDRIDGQLGDAVRDALVADVPVGSYLSGGVDSSLIVALAAREVAPAPLQTFSAEFGDPRYDESEHARTVSQLFRTVHHEVAVRADDFTDVWETLTWHRDAPISEPADVAVFRLAEAARQHVKVVLSGEGSDELFGGYPKYQYAELTEKLGAVPSGVRTRLFRLLERALPASGNRLRIALRAQTADSLPGRLATWFAPFTAYECEELLGVDVRSVAGDVPHRDAIDLLGRLDTLAWLPDNLLERGDRMSMAASLELRPPFMDYRLVETAFRLPSDLKVREGSRKWIVKQVASRYLPDTIVNRPKLGFRVPLDAWFRAGLRDMAHDLLLGPDSFVASVADPAVVRQLLSSHDRGRRNEEIRIWTLLSLEVWGRKFLRG